MSNPYPDVFFDLSTFKHASLFAENTFVWEALSALPSYFENYSQYTIEGEISSSAYLQNRQLISIGKNSVVEPGAMIVGPCILGSGCVVRHGAYIRGGVIAGDGCVIGHATEVKNAIFLDKAKAAHFAYIGDTILGNGVNLGAGVKCANVKIDKSAPKALFHGITYQTSLKKFGAIVGDSSELGCNSVTSPATLIEKEALIYPLIHVRGHVARGAKLAEKEGSFVLKKRAGV